MSLFYSLHLYVAEKMKAILETSPNNNGEEEDLKLPLFDLSTMSRATNNFSEANKLGQGGFGAVYKVTIF